MSIKKLQTQETRGSINKPLIQIHPYREILEQNLEICF